VVTIAARPVSRTKTAAPFAVIASAPDVPSAVTASAAWSRSVVSARPREIDLDVGGAGAAEVADVQGVGARAGEDVEP